MAARWLYPLQAIDPENPPNGSWEVGIPERLFRRIQNQGHEAKFARLILVEEVLQGGTDEIYARWSRPGKDDCLVYVGRPSRDFRSMSIETPPPRGMVFAVFVLAGGAIDDWNWRPAAEFEGETTRPDGVKGKLIWPKSQT